MLLLWINISIVIAPKPLFGYNYRCSFLPCFPKPRITTFTTLDEEGMKFYRKTEFIIVAASIIATVGWLVLANKFFFAGKPHYTSAEIIEVLMYKGVLFIAALTAMAFLMVRDCKKRIEAGVHEYKNLFDNHPDTLLIYDSVSNRIVQANQAAIELYGYSHDEWKSLSLLDLHSANRPTYLKGITLSSTLFVHEKKNGEQFVCAQTMRDVYFDNKHQKLVAIHDETVMIRSIAERKQNMEKIERQNRKLKDIAFITSHAVRAPLTNILGLINILDYEQPMSAFNKNVIKLIEHSAHELDDKIKTIVSETIIEDGEKNEEYYMSLYKTG